MRDVDGGGALREPQLQEILHQQVARLCIQRRERLVEEQDRRPHRERARDADALAHAAGELLRKGRSKFQQAGAREHVLDAPCPLLRRQRMMLECKGHVAFDRAPRQQREILKDVGEGIERAGRRLALHQHAALARLQDAAHDAEQGRLAAAGRPDHREGLAFAHRQIDPLQSQDIAVAMTHILDDQLQETSARCQ
jgi:hypothetical protein